MSNSKTVLVTGCAGFIGMHMAAYLLNKNFNVIGIDNLNNYYSVKLKKKRLANLLPNKKFYFIKSDICEISKIKKLKKMKIDHIIHLAAQAGVRYSFSNPDIFFLSNIKGTYEIIKFAKDKNIKNFISASSSSIYGDLKKDKFEESDKGNPLSFYGLTKKISEDLNNFFLKDINHFNLRFFTVYGPWGRPDMAVLKFINQINNNKKIYVFNNGNMFRDFTYIDDVINTIYKLLISNNKKIKNYNNLNVGFSNKVKLSNLISLIESSLDKKAKIIHKVKNDFEMTKTKSDSTKLISILGKGYKPVSINSGIIKTVEWYFENINKFKI